MISENRDTIRSASNALSVRQPLTPTLSPRAGRGGDRRHRVSKKRNQVPSPHPSWGEGQTRKDYWSGSSLLRGFVVAVCIEAEAFFDVVFEDRLEVIGNV